MGRESFGRNASEEEAERAGFSNFVETGAIETSPNANEVSSMMPERTPLRSIQSHALIDPVSWLEPNRIEEISRDRGAPNAAVRRTSTMRTAAKAAISALHVDACGAYCPVEMTNGNNGINSIVQEFTAQLTALIERETQARMQASVLAALGTPVRRGPGRPPKNGLAVFSVASSSSRPKQFCPVPGCKNVAAPVFGMVCAAHKNLPKGKIKEYREARRKAKREGQTRGATAGATRRKIRATPKVLKARKLQGQYMGALRTLSGTARARVKAVAKDKGVSEALKLAQSLKKAA